MRFSKCGANFTLQSFQKNVKISFLRIPRVLFRVLISSQVILQIGPNKFCSKIKIQKTIWVKFGTLNRTFVTLKNEIFKNYLKTLKRHNFFNFDLEQNVLWLICRIIWIISRTLNRTLGTLENKF